jgi:hypothetical protein
MSIRTIRLAAASALTVLALGTAAGAAVAASSSSHAVPAVHTAMVPLNNPWPAPSP